MTFFILSIMLMLAQSVAMQSTTMEPLLELSYSKFIKDCNTTADMCVYTLTAPEMSTEEYKTMMTALNLTINNENSQNQTITSLSNNYTTYTLDYGYLIGNLSAKYDVLLSDYKELNQNVTDMEATITDLYSQAIQIEAYYNFVLQTKQCYNGYVNKTCNNAPPTEAGPTSSYPITQVPTDTSGPVGSTVSAATKGPVGSTVSSATGGPVGSTVSSATGGSVGSTVSAGPVTSVATTTADSAATTTVNPAIISTITTLHVESTAGTPNP
uniref:DUF148 domain-containing protein n=1 Tax=Rhabditophanes sp. KR3021 TaxID=114890 RepID=A0AC35U878_9BILA